MKSKLIRIPFTQWEKLRELAHIKGTSSPKELDRILSENTELQAVKIKRVKSETDGN